MTRRSASLSIRSTLVLGMSALAIGCSESTSPARDAGTLVTRLTDAPFPTGQVRNVDVYILRVDARQSDVTDADASSAIDDQNSASNGWRTVATPNRSYNLLSLQNGIAATLGQANLPAGTYSGFRLIIDQSKASATLEDGTVLTGGSSPGIRFPSAGQSGIKILLSQPVKIVAGTETDLLVDFNVGQSFVMRGNTIQQNGLLFKPVINAVVTNRALTNSNVRLANATDGVLNLLQRGTVLPGASSIAFGASSACTSVDAAAPALAITQGASATPLTGFAPTLSVGHPFTFVAFSGTASAVQFATVEQPIPALGQSQLLAFNATGLTSPVDVYVTVPGAPLGTPTIANIGTGSASASFVTVPVGSSQIRVTSTGVTTVLLDIGTHTFTAGQNEMLVIAPPATGGTALRAFLVPGC